MDNAAENQDKKVNKYTVVEEEEEKIVMNKETILKDLEEIENDELFSNNESSYLEKKFNNDIPRKYKSSYRNLNKIAEKETVDGTVSYYENSIRTILSKDQKTFTKVD